MACTALLRDETQSTMNTFLSQMKEIFDPSFFFVDKDFGQLESLRRIFPEAQLFLCAFHVLK